MSDLSDAPGFFGKLPSHGDFITRRLARGFLDTWDEWLQKCLAESKASLGDEAWLDAYLTAPIWCFALQPGICGARGWAGILMPSVDRVGRYFPLTIATPLPTGMTPLQAATTASEWFGRAVTLALTSLEQEDFTLEPFDEAVAGLGAIASPTSVAGGSLILQLAGASRARLPLDATGNVGAIQRLVDGVVGRPLAPYALWWSEGSERVEASLLWTRKLPASPGFLSFITGAWDSETWVQAVATEWAETPGTAGASLP